MRKRNLLLAAGACLATLTLTVGSAVADPTGNVQPSPPVGVAAPGGGSGGVNPACAKNFWAMDLTTGVQIGSLLPGSSVIPGTQITGPASQAVVQLDLNPNSAIKCRRANIVVEYEGPSNAWTVNIGDSPTNNGYGGGVPGTTQACAEVQVVNNTVSAYKHCPLPAFAGPLALLPNPNPLSLKDGALKFVVGDRYLSVGQPFATPTLADLAQSFHIPDTLGPNPDGSKIYAAFNRVIFGPGNRVGTGARRVMITME